MHWGRQTIRVRCCHWPPFRQQAFAVNSWGSSLLRMSVGAVPLMLPLMFQIGYGMNAFPAGRPVLNVRRQPDHETVHHPVDELLRFPPHPCRQRRIEYAGICGNAMGGAQCYPHPVSTASQLAPGMGVAHAPLPRQGLRPHSTLRIMPCAISSWRWNLSVNTLHRSGIGPPPWPQRRSPC